MASPTHPLPAGQILYSVQDTSIISEHDGHALLQRVNFTGTGNDPKATVQNRIDLGRYDDIQCVRAVTHHLVSQEVAVLMKTGLSSIAMHAGTARLQAVQTKVEDALLIIGFDPIQTEQRSLALLVSSSGGFAVVQVDLDSGVREAPKQLPPQVRGTVVATELARCGSSTMLVVTTIAESSGKPSDLLVHAVDWNHLALQVQPEHVKTLTLGSVLTSSDQIAQQTETWLYQTKAAGRWGDITVEHAPFFNSHLANHDQVAAIVTNMRAKSSDQQLAVAWYDATGKCRIALVGWGNGGEAGVLAEMEVQTPLYKHTEPVCRLAAADLFHSGTDQLVLGFPGERFVMLQLFTLEEPGGAAATMKCESTYVVDGNNGDGGGFAGYDLHIGAGIFGTCMGVVQVIGTKLWAWHLSQGDTREGFIECGFVSVDPVRRAFPDMNGNTPGPARMAEASPRVPFPPEWELVTWAPGFVSDACGLVPFTGDCRFRAFPSDLGGESVVLGPPKLVQVPAYTQILAIIQAHPFERRFVDNYPTVSFSTVESETHGLSVTSDASWTFSDDISLHLGLGALSLSKSIHNSYLKSLGNTDDTSITKTETIQKAFTNADMMLVSEIRYNIWRYPVIRGCANNPAGGEMLVIVPEDLTPSIDMVQTDDYAYRPRAEVGMLLSYLNLEPEGYQRENELFTHKGYDVVLGPDTASETFDMSESTTQTFSTHLNILHSESMHSGISASTELFDFLPASFSLNVGTNQSYSQSEVKSTHVNMHKGVTISVHSGTLGKDYGDYKYRVTPVIYQHDRLGCLMLTWQVDTSAGWKTPRVTAPQPCLIRVNPDSKGEIGQAFSRAISFVERPDGTMDIEVEIFNNGLSAARHVSCEFFDVSSEFSHGWPADIKPLMNQEHHLAKVDLDGELKPVERRKVTLGGHKLPDPVYIAVRLFMDSIPFGVYWGVHPGDKFFQPALSV